MSCKYPLNLFPHSYRCHLNSGPIIFLLDGLLISPHPIMVPIQTILYVIFLYLVAWQTWMVTGNWQEEGLLAVSLPEVETLFQLHSPIVFV